MSSLESLISRMQDHQKRISSKKGKKKMFPYDKCELSFKTSRELNEHVGDNHDENLKQSMPPLKKIMKLMQIRASHPATLLMKNMSKFPSQDLTNLSKAIPGETSHLLMIRLSVNVDFPPPVSLGLLTTNVTRINF